MHVPYCACTAFIIFPRHILLIVPRQKGSPSSSSQLSRDVPPAWQNVTDLSSLPRPICQEVWVFASSRFREFGKFILMQRMNLLLEASIPRTLALHSVCVCVCVCVCEGVCSNVCVCVCSCVLYNSAGPSYVENATFTNFLFTKHQASMLSLTNSWL